MRGTARAELIGRLLPPRAERPPSARLPALPPAPQPLPDEPPRRGEKEREEDDHRQHQHDGRAGGKPLLGEAEQRADRRPASAPNDAERTIIAPNRFVHCRAAAAGPISIAAISTTPTVCMNLDLLEENYRRWQENPDDVDSTLVGVFRGLSSSATCRCAMARPRSRRRPERAAAPEGPLQTRIDGLVYAYRTLGHTIAQLNPLADKRPENPLLKLRELGFSEKDLDLQVSSKFFLDNKRMTLREMIARLESHLCRHDRRGVPAHPEHADAQLGAPPARIASAESKRVARGADRDAAHAARGGAVRDVPAHALRRAEALLAPGRGGADGRSSTPSCRSARTSAWRRFAWGWRIAAGSTCSRIS